MKKSENFIFLVILFAVIGSFALASINVYKVNEKKCIGCGVCVEECPVNAITMKNGKAVIDSSKCINCGKCEQVCPAKAISKIISGKAQNEKKDDSTELKEKTKVESKDTVNNKSTNSEKTNNVEQGKRKAETTKTSTKDAKGKSEEIDELKESTDTTNAEKDSEGKAQYKVLKEKCTGCEKCVEVCPVDAIKIIDGKAIIDPDKCIECGKCYSTCPFNAIINNDNK